MSTRAYVVSLDQIHKSQRSGWWGLLLLLALTLRAWSVNVPVSVSGLTTVSGDIVNLTGDVTSTGDLTNVLVREHRLNKA